VKEVLYNGPELAIRVDGIRIKRRKLTLKYEDISSIKIRKARISRLWLIFILAGIVLNILLIFLLYRILTDFYFISDTHTRHFQYARRSQGMIIGFLVILPVIIFLWMKKYFKRFNMLIIIWNHSEFRVKLDDLHMTVSELKRDLEGKVKTLLISSKLMT
jgi:hypothetical protein